MLPIIIDLGEVELFGTSVGIRLHGYGLMLVLGFLGGIYLARWRARRFGENPDAVATLGLLALVGGVVGARIAYVIEQWDSFARMSDPLARVLDITSGGLIYYGGVALATAMALCYLALKRLPIRRYLDIIAPSLMVGLAFGRMGCLLNGCCFGGACAEHFPLATRFPYASEPLLLLGEQANRFGGASVSPAFVHQVALAEPDSPMHPSKLPRWLLLRDREGQLIPHAEGRYKGGPVVTSPSRLSPQEAREAGALKSMPLQPAQAYGIVNAIMIAGLLLWLSRLRRREGQVFLLMLILYAITRFILESIRGDNPHDLLSGYLTHNQYVSVGMVAVGLILWHSLRWLPAGAGPRWSERRMAANTAKLAISKKKKGRS